jgi:multimeric flavodoxin WrbA
MAKPDKGLGVLGLLGSPRRNGHTAALLTAFLAGAAEAGARVESLRLGEMTIAPCQACYSCRETGWCALGDDFQYLFDRIKRAKVIALAAPVFFSGLPAQTKAAVDRCQVFWVAKHRRGESLIPPGPRAGAFLSTKGTPGEKGFAATLSGAKAFFITVETPLAGEILVPGLEESPSVLLPQEELTRAEALGERIVRGISGK